MTSLELGGDPAQLARQLEEINARAAAQHQLHTDPRLTGLRFQDPPTPTPRERP